MPTIDYCIQRLLKASFLRVLKKKRQCTQLAAVQSSWIGSKFNTKYLTSQLSKFQLLNLFRTHYQWPKFIRVSVFLERTVCKIYLRTNCFISMCESDFLQIQELKNHDKQKLIESSIYSGLNSWHNLFRTPNFLTLFALIDWEIV